MAPMYTQVDSGRVFKCWFEHPADGVASYAYALLPCHDVAGTKAFAKAYASGKDAIGKAHAERSKKTSGVQFKTAVPTVLRNDDSCQAVSYIGNVYVIVHIHSQTESSISRLPESIFVPMTGFTPSRCLRPSGRTDCPRSLPYAAPRTLSGVCRTA